MPAKQIVFALITFLHDLFTVIWVGGLITLGITVLPAAKEALGKGPQMKKLMDTIQRRLSTLVYISIVGLLVTGLLQARHNAAFQGLFTFGNTYSAVLSIKHILVLVMIGVALYRSLVLGRRSGPPSPSQGNLSVTLLLLNMSLGVIVLLLSGFTTALSVVPPA
ncbi:MAG: CopD family protein [Anaerolineae bacterium]|nr:CopD family protein [Anaerolineae bacterium]